MKRLTALTLALAMLLLLFTGCAKTRQEESSMQDKLHAKQTPGVQTPAQTQPHEPAQPTTTGKTPIKGSSAQHPTYVPREEVPVCDYSRFEGIYKAPSEGWQTVVLEVRAYSDILLLEYGAWEDGSLAYSWAEEFWPDGKIVEDGGLGHVSGQYQGFSVVDGRADYWSAAAPRTIALTEDGLLLQEGDIAYTYRRDDTLPTIHSTFAEQKSALSGQPSAELVGEWEYSDIYTAAFLRLGEDGSFFSIVKEPHRPASVLQGAWALGSEEGEITVCAAWIGDMEETHELTFTYYPDGGGLFLAYYGEELCLPGGGGLYFWQSSGEWSSGFTLEQRSSVYYDLLYEYDVVEYAEDYYEYHYYHIAQFLEDYDSETLWQINEEIRECYWELALTELERIGNGEMPVIATIDYDYCSYDGLEQLIFWSAGYYEYPQCTVYCYDRAQDVRLGTRELLARLGISEQDFLTAVRDAARTYYEESNRDVPEDERQAYGYDERLAWTLSDEAINLDLPVFVTQYEEIAVVAPIGSMAGISYDYVTLYPFE